jgi:hypothetical protein
MKLRANCGLPSRALDVRKLVELRKQSKENPNGKIFGFALCSGSKARLREKIDDRL